jgi:anti-sigma B factor antagonist
MKYSVDKQEKYTLIQLDEEKLDTTLAPKLKSELVTFNAEGTKNLILDLSKVKYCDSSGLSALLVANRLCHDSDGVLVISGVRDHVHKLIKISQLESVFNLMPTVEESVDAIFMSEIENDLKKDVQ